jgi:hypothetical protein
MHHIFVNSQQAAPGSIKSRFNRYAENWTHFFTQLTMTPEEVIFKRAEGLGKPQCNLQKKHVEFCGKIQEDILKDNLNNLSNKIGSPTEF